MDTANADDLDTLIAATDVLAILIAALVQILLLQILYNEYSVLFSHHPSAEAAYPLKDRAPLVVREEGYPSASDFEGCQVSPVIRFQ